MKINIVEVANDPMYQPEPELEVGLAMAADGSCNVILNKSLVLLSIDKNGGVYLRANCWAGTVRFEGKGRVVFDPVR